jgi:hypothetical protein
MRAAHGGRLRLQHLRGQGVARVWGGWRGGWGWGGVRDWCRRCLPAQWRAARFPLSLGVVNSANNAALSPCLCPRCNCIRRPAASHLQRRSSMAPFKVANLGGKLEVPIICLGAFVAPAAEARDRVAAIPPPALTGAPATGTMTWGDVNTEAEAHEQLDHALAAGVNFLDTAELCVLRAPLRRGRARLFSGRQSTLLCATRRYPVPPQQPTQGRTEKYIGNWLAARGCRDQVLPAPRSLLPPRLAMLFAATLGALQRMIGAVHAQRTRLTSFADAGGRWWFFAGDHRHQGGRPHPRPRQVLHCQQQVRG